MAELLSALEAEGFTFGLEQHLQWQKMLARLPDDLPAEQLKTIVCPLIAADEEEQDLIYSVFDECWERVQLMNESPLAATKKGWNLPIPLPWMLFWTSILVALITIFVLPIKERIPPRIIENTFTTVSPGQNKKICIDQRKLADKPRMIGSQLVDRSIKESPLGIFDFGNGCLEYQSKGIKGADTIAVEFMELDGFRWYTNFYVFVDEVQLDTIEKPIAQKRINKNQDLFNYKQYPFENDISELETPPLHFLEEFYQKYAKWIKLFLATLIIALLAKILLDREKKRKKLVADLAPRNKIFPIWNLRPSLLEEIKTGNLFFALLNKLRQRTPDDFYRLNIPKTVNQTIKKAGMVEFQYDLQTRPPEYILLVDGASASNHLAKIFELLCTHFQASEVYIERFFIDEESQLCYNENFPTGLSLGDLQEQYYNSRLLILASVYQPKAAFFAKLDQWQWTFNHWENPAILLPVPILSEVVQNHALQDTFSLIPATMEGIDYLLEQETASGKTVKKVVTQTEILSQEIANLKTGIVPFFQANYSEDLTKWIAACAIYPSLHWNLTTHLGKVLATSDTELLTLENLFALTNLPWFINGRIPEAIRTELIEFLQTDYPGLYEELNQEITELLQNETLFNEGQSIANQEAVVGLDKNTLEKEQQAKFDREKANQNRFDPNPSSEIPVITKLGRKEKVLDFLIPENWRQQLKQLGFPNLGRKEFWRDVLQFALPVLIAALSFLWWLPEEWDHCDGELVEYVYKDKPITLCISTPEEWILLNEYIARDAILAQRESTVDSTRKAVMKTLMEAGFQNSLPPSGTALDTARQSYFGNVGVEYYNRGVQFYTDFVKSNAGAADEEVATNTLKGEACYHFGKALTFDSLDIDIVSAVEWCLKKKEPEFITLSGQVLASSDQQPLENAKVIHESQATITDSLGQFSFSISKNADSTKVKLLVSKLAYLKTEGEFAVERKDSFLYLIDAILLETDPAQMQKYTIKGQFLDSNTQQSPAENINVFIAGDLEAISVNGQFQLDIAEDRMSNKSIKLRFEGQGYQTIIQEVLFDENTSIELTIPLVPLLSDNFETVAAEEINLEDSIEYLLNRILETSEAPTAINFEIPKPKMEFIEGSTFAMGDVMGDGGDKKSSLLPHVVTLNSFYIGAYEVTFEEFDRYTDATGLGAIGDAGWGRGRQPAFQVSWYQAVEYCNWLSEQLGYDKVYTIDKNNQDPNNKSRQDALKWTVTADWTANGYRLPTEAEWEYAARQGGQKTRYGNGKDIATTQELNYAAEPSSKKPYVKSGENRRQTVEIGTFSPNTEGLYEMSGNVPEWVWDWMGEYPNYAETNPTGPEEGQARILRGGSFAFPGNQIKTYSRYGSVPTRVNGLGFRLCRSAK